MQGFANYLWYKNAFLGWLLWPLSLIYQLITSIRRFYLRTFKQTQFPVPVIVIGNLTVGGVGKTPLVLAIAAKLKEKGLKVGIVSRGYKAKVDTFPHEVSMNDSAVLVGDEPFLLAKNAACPVVIAPNRVEAVQYLLNKYKPDIILSDDGLQHYALGRTIEVLVIDGIRGLGNQLCLPAGPLREAKNRLKQTDFLVVNHGQWPGAFAMELQPGNLKHLKSGATQEIKDLVLPLAAVAGIGHPERFFNTLEKLQLSFTKYPFKDHHHFCRDELQFKEKSVIMTEKDAVKCSSFAEDSWYFLPVEAKLSDSFWQALWSHKQLQGYI